MTARSSTLTVWLTELREDDQRNITKLTSIECRWRFEGDTNTHIGTLEHLQDHITSQSKSSQERTACTLVIPGEYVTSIRITAPGKQALKAVPFLIEERLSSPLEDLHICHHTLKNNTELLTLCIDRLLLQNLLSRFEEIGLTPRTVIPDYALIPQDHKLNCVVDGSRNLCKLPNGEGLSLSENDKPLLQIVARQHETDIEYHTLSAHQLLERDHREHGHYTLLTGAFKPKSDTGNRQWVATGFFSLAASLIIVVGYALWAGWQFDSQANTDYASAEAHYRKLFPEARHVTNLRRQLQGKLNQANPTGNSASHFLFLLNQSAPAFDQADNYEIRQMRYNSNQDTLQVELVSRNMNALNHLQASLQQQQLTSSIRSTNNIESGVLARLDVSQ